VIAAHAVGALSGLEGRRMSRSLAAIATAASGFVLYVFWIVFRSGGFGGLPHSGMVLMLVGAVSGFFAAFYIALDRAT